MTNVIIVVLFLLIQPFIVFVVFNLGYKQGKLAQAEIDKRWNQYLSTPYSRTHRTYSANNEGE